MKTRSLLLWAALFVLTVQTFPAQLQGQAWTLPKGQFVFSFDYQYLQAGNHLFSEAIVNEMPLPSRSIDLGRVDSQVLFFRSELALTDRLTVTATVATVSARYNGSNPENHDGQPIPTDDGNWHGGFQDGSIGARFRLWENEQWSVTPSVSYGFPTTDYPAQGHTALGRNLNELRVGMNVGRVLSHGGAPDSYFQTSYSYAFMEDFEHVGLDRSDLTFEFGYFLPRSVTLQAFTNYQHVHGGVDWSQVPAHDIEEHGPLSSNHDASAATRFWHLGGGLSFPLSDRAEVYGSLSKTLWGINTHDAWALNFGISWNFQLFGGRGVFGK